MVLVTEAVPFCFLPDMYELAVEDRIPETTVIDLDGAPFDGAPCARGAKDSGGSISKSSAVTSLFPSGPDSIVAFWLEKPSRADD